MATSKRLSGGAPDGDYPALWTRYGFVFSGNDDYFGFSAKNPSPTGTNARLEPLYFISIGNLNLLTSRINFAGSGGASWVKNASADINTSYDYGVNVGLISPTIRDPRWYGFSLRYSYDYKHELIALTVDCR